MRGKVNRIFVVLGVIVLLLILSWGSTLVESWKFNREIQKEIDVLISNRPEEAWNMPDFTGGVSNIRMTVVPRKYYAGDYLGRKELFQNITLLQVWYGYYSEGVWHDIPSENYELWGILDGKAKSGWMAAKDSHMVKIGPYVLICIIPGAYLDWECEISDTLNSEVQEPFEEYFTYYSYVDDSGNEHFFMDDHSNGYGLLLENPAHPTDLDSTIFHTQYTFSRHYYLVLDYESLPENYELCVTYSTPNDTRAYTLTYDEIYALVEGH